MNDIEQVEITVDVWCREGDELYQPAYRIFVDGDLLAERNYLWTDTNLFIREHIYVDIGPGKHYLKVDRIGDVRDSLMISNIKVNGNPADFEFSV